MLTSLKGKLRKGRGGRLVKGKETISKKQAEEDVKIVAKRLALLYRCFCDELKKELGQEKARIIVKNVIKKYGAITGKETGETVEKMGLDKSLANYSKGKDLPSVGWEFEQLKCDAQELQIGINYCPLAEKWKELGQSDFDRLYCSVDQEKYKAYNQNLICSHFKNVLDGDEYCVLHIKYK